MKQPVEKDLDNVQKAPNKQTSQIHEEQENYFQEIDARYLSI